MWTRRITALVVTLGALPIAGPATAGATTYGGVTKDGDPMVITTSGKQVRSMTLHWAAPCPSGNVIMDAGTVRYSGPPPTAAPPSLTVGQSHLYTTPMSKAGKFTGNIYGALDIDPGYFLPVTGVLSGKLGKSGGSGGYTLMVSVFELPAGTMLESCTVSGTWKVAHDARTYSGATSQDQPIVVKLNAARTRVTGMFVGFRVGCPDNSFFQPSEAFTFGLSRAGQFGASIPSSGPADGGGTRDVSRSFSGTVKRAVAKGSFNISMTETDAQGVAQPACSTQDVTWKAVNT